MYKGTTRIIYPAAMAKRAFQLLIDESHKENYAPDVVKVDTETNSGGLKVFVVTVEGQDEEEDL